MDQWYWRWISGIGDGSVVLEMDLCYWRRLLRVPRTARRSNQSLKEISLIGRTDAEAETPILWPPDPTHWKRP